jgi:hypothetical protein
MLERLNPSWYTIAITVIVILDGMYGLNGIRINNATYL